MSIYQELVLFPELTVAENVMFGAAPRNRLGLIDHRARHRRAQAVLAELGVEVDPRALVEHLSVADQQMIEIAKALVGEARLLILDEPTAVISGREAELLFERVRRLRERGVAIVYISHRLEEIFQIADRVTVLKDGRRVGSWPLAATTAGDWSRDGRARARGHLPGQAQSARAGRAGPRGRGARRRRARAAA